MLKKGERSKRIVERIVPFPAFGEITEIIEPEIYTKIAEGMRGLIGPSGACELKSIDPWTEGMPRKSAEEALLSSMSVSDDGATRELAF